MDTIVETEIYHNVFKHSLNAVFIVDSNAMIIETNRSGAKLLGYDIDDIIGSKIWRFLPHRYIAIAEKRWQQFLETGEQESIFTFLNHEHELVYSEYRAVANVSENRHIAFLRDITEKKDIEQELQKSEARYERLTSIYPVGIFHTDTLGRDLYINNRAAEIMGTKFDTAMGYGWEQNLHPDDSEFVKSTWYHAVRNGTNINIEYRFRHPDGRVRWVKGESVPERDAKGKIIGYVGTLTDITKLHDAEEQIRQTQIEIAHYARVNSMGELASGIAHELNQPLTAIANYAHGCIRRLEKENVKQDIHHSLTQIASQAERAGSIINHLKDFLRKGTPSTETCEINTCITNVINIMVGIAENQSVVLITNLGKDIPKAYADNISVEQVLVNLLSNGIEALSETKKAIKTINIKSYRKDNSVIMTIEDNGPGISTSLIESIFNPFITTKEQGMGIGLSLSKNIIERYHGTLTCCNKNSGGAKFTITLPLMLD